MFYKMFAPLTVLLCVLYCSSQPVKVDLKVRKEALEYYRKLHTESSCGVPQPRVISVQQIHPNPSVVYATSCVILHQCAFDSGCCPSSHECTVKDSEKVDIPILFGKPAGIVQKMTFTNHTSCECAKMKQADSNSA